MVFEVQSQNLWDALCKSVYFQMVYVEKILVDHIRLFGGSENVVKMGFLC